MKSLAGSVALVTGGAGGIGRACVRKLRAAGAKVVVVDADRRALTRLGSLVPTADRHFGDVADPELARRVVRAVVARHRRLDHLVLAAGICRDGVLWKMTDTAWTDVIAVNLTGCANFLRAAAPELRSRPGRVILIGSINGRRGKFGQTNYAAAKAGLIGLARSAARELAKSGTTVNVIEPGLTETAMTRDLPAEARLRALGESLLGRAADPDDIADAVLFFAGPSGRHVTGQILAVDGGQSLGA